ncbi:MAG: cupredoxin domain-containing protein [Gaiellaceae bacterium]
MLPKFGNSWLRALVVSALLASAASCYSSGKGGYPTSPSPGPVTGKELDSGDIGHLASYQHQFATAGTYHYHCIHHGPMTGTVVVDPNAPSSSASVSIISMTAPFAPATVKPGGTVTWTNQMTELHTVTSD